MGFEAVEQQPSFPALEERVLARWAERKIFERSLEARAGAPLWRVYEGPPTANGTPGVHHVPARTFKDVFPRYRTMKGLRVPRYAGWDCHGIPVEVQVERELGITRKREIEEFGVAEFNARCRESVTRYVDDWIRLTERIAYWVDFDEAYWTMSSEYVESVWWSLKELWDRGLIYEGHKVVPYCPRCGTALSDHEVAQGYAETDDPSVFVRFPVLEGPLAEEGAALLIWTTTPWTLISNTTVAVGPDVRYVLADGGDFGPLVLAADLVAAVLGPDATVLRDVALDELRGMHYQAPFDYVEVDGDWRYVTVSDVVTTAEGSGLVHMAPAFGADDMAVGLEHGLPVVNPVDLEGRFTDEITDFAGQFVKDADADITEHLRARGFLVRSGTYRHTFPFCWRCDTPLLYYAKPSWYIATTRIRDRLLEVNAGVDWHPEHTRDGRYGNWLANNVDWALSRERYWGAPLPLWRCEDGHVTAIGSRAELGERAGRDLGDLDPHRPFVDEVTFDCPECGSVSRRVPEVIDAWYDSGSMPFAQFGYPHADGSEQRFTEFFPAQYICEGLDQTRGWFYSLMAVSTLLFDRNSYETVLCLGIVVDADGQKMSKSRGNVVDPWDIIGRHGADALRWRLLSGGSPWVEQRVGHEPVAETVRRFFLTLWNTYYFFATYARIDGWTPEASAAAPPGERPVMDRWILAELAETVRAVDAALDAFDATGAGRALEDFVDALSNWYVRRNRNRFWSASQADDPDKAAAFATLHACLVEVAKLLAPFTPFLADELYENLVRAVDRDALDSVHLCDFPTPDLEAANPELRAAMATARRVVELGRRARNEARIPTRQPLRAALVMLPAEERAGWRDVADVVADELNVKAVELPEDAGGLVTHRIKPNFRALGPVHGKRTPEVAAAIEAADAGRVAAALADAGEATITVGDDAVTVTAAQVQVLEEARTGWEVVSDGPYSVALDLTIDAELRAEGIAREFVRAVNDLRKQADLALDDRIVLRVDADGDVARALDAHRDWIAGEVLAIDWRDGADDGAKVELGDGAAVRVGLDVAR